MDISSFYLRGIEITQCKVDSMHGYTVDTKNKFLTYVLQKTVYISY